MANPVLLETTRGSMVENRHRGAAAICDASGDVVEAWGDIDAAILPRSSIKMIQALPLIESGAAAAARLTPKHLALSCASHEGSPIHTEAVAAWLNALGLTPEALLCGPQAPRDPAVKDQPASRLLNNCSGKHAGFLTLAQHIGADLDGYLAPDGPIQTGVEAAFAKLTGATAPLAYGIDGCSAPNFAAPLVGVARAMALFASPERLGTARGGAARDLITAMAAHPVLFSGEGRACLALTSATGGRAVVKTGADGVYTGIFPEKGLGFCIKVESGFVPACEAICAALLVRIGALDAEHPTAKGYLNRDITDFNSTVVGERRVTL